MLHRWMHQQLHSDLSAKILVFAWLSDLSSISSWSSISVCPLLKEQTEGWSQNSLVKEQTEGWSQNSSVKDQMQICVTVSLESKEHSHIVADSWM